MISFESLYTAFLKAASVSMLALAFALIVGLVLLLYEKFWGQEDVGSKTGSVALSFVFGVLALSVGLLMSSARVDTVSAILPAALTFIGGIGIYLVTKEHKAAVSIGVIVVSFSFMLIAGATLGYHERYRSEQRANNDGYNIQTLKWKADVEYRINTYRAALGLDKAF